jgi:hypothetical protein
MGLPAVRQGLNGFPVSFPLFYFYRFCHLTCFGAATRILGTFFVFHRADFSCSAIHTTLKRILTDLIADNYLITSGRGKGTKYLLSPAYELICPIDIQRYYEKEIDERQIIENFNSEIITEVLRKRNSLR